MDKTAVSLAVSLGSGSIDLAGLTRAFTRLTASLPQLPGEAACQQGCAWCCHLRVGTSIPEVLAIFQALRSGAAPGDPAFFRRRVRAVAAQGNTLSEDFWLSGQHACPFLSGSQRACLIYTFRPVSCRAFHSTDASVCRRGFDTGTSVRVPCFPLYRSAVDCVSTVFIRVLADKGLASFQVGFVKALDILFKDSRAADRWLAGEDVFHAARVSNKDLAKPLK